MTVIQAMMSSEIVPSSFRDPSGFVFVRNGIVYRQVNTVYTHNYNHLVTSGLYKKLLEENLLVEHVEVEMESVCPDLVYKVIKPQEIPFISYPYEWSFSQLRDAALATLAIQKHAIDYEMSLKDCSAYNVQFFNGKPLFIDTLSFERYREGNPWVAYRQFCQHFLAPLTLMSQRHTGLGQLLKIHLDGIPLDLTSSLLPTRTWMKISLLSHIHLHARSQRHYEGREKPIKHAKLSRLSLLGLIDNLMSTVRSMKWNPVRTEWADYYQDTSYSSQARKHKEQLVSELIDEIKPEEVWDIGANTGVFSRIAAEKGVRTISIDSDPATVEKNYLKVKGKGEANVYPLLIDLTNPSPAIGWENRERMSLIERGPVDLVLALALIHHLAISNNIPFDRIASFLRQISHAIIIEFIPKEDRQVQRLLATREDVFPLYHQKNFEEAFKTYFNIKRSATIVDSGRILYMMTTRGSVE